MKVVLEFSSDSISIHICCFGDIIAVPEILRITDVVMKYIKVSPVRCGF